MRNIVLIGFMGTGKSSTGRRLARRLGWAFVDVDERIEAREGRPVAEIFHERGEAHFRDVESAVIAEVAAGGQQVIATGGGAVLRPENVARLRAAGPLVCLTADVGTIAQRVERKGTRPLLAGEGDLQARIARLLAERAPAYAAADITIDTTGQSAEAVAEAVERQAQSRA